MKFTRNVLSVALGISAISSPALLQAAETARTMEEVVVTSRRKDESVQDVPLSVTAFGEEAIEQLKPTTLRDFDGLAPNLYIGMNAAGPNGSLYIRGIGYAGSEKTQSPQVGVIVDGAQLGSITGALIDTFDVESIEVNRGPQGVLYGKNTIGGNIVVNRVKPQFNEFGFRTSAAVGNYSSRDLKARLNIPLVDDTLAMKIGMIDRSRDGFYDNVARGGSAGDVDFASQTLSLRWAPNDNIDAILTYDRIDDQTDQLPMDPRFNGDDRFETNANKDEPMSYEADQISLRVDWDISDKMTLHSVTASSDATDTVNQDFDGAGVDGAAIPFAQLHTLRDQDFEVFSQELRLDVALSDSLDLMVGYYYFESDLEFRQDTNNILQLPSVVLGLPPGVPCAVVPGLRANPGLGDALCQFSNARSTQLAGEDVESSAIFASLTWRPTETIELSVGARRIDEEKDGFNGYTDYTNGVFDDGSQGEFDFSGYPVNPGASYTISDDWDETITTASASWQAMDNVRLYASYSEGFRSGGFSIRAVDSNTAPYLPETAEQVEFGMKSDWMEGRLRLNLAYFDIERDKGQFISIITLPPGSIPGTNTIINNGEGSTSEGWELETSYHFNDNWSISMNYGDIEVDSDVFFLPCEVLDGCSTGIPGLFDPIGTPRELGGSSDSRAPEKNWSVKIAYVGELGGGTLAANIGYKKVGDFLLVNTGGGADQRLYEGSYGQTDMQIAWERNLENGHTFSISVFGKNLGDTEFKEHALFLGGPDTGFQGWGAPKTYAAEFRYSM
jgi:iron complex outermembrane receptor protein